MKIKSTQKEIKRSFPYVIAICYCCADALLRGKEPLAYIANTYGWCSDIYDCGNTAISTGYSPFGITPPTTLVKKYNRLAEDIWDSCYTTDLTFEEAKEQVNELLKIFVEEVIEDPVYCDSRKTPDFSHGDIRRMLNY